MSQVTANVSAQRPIDIVTGQVGRVARDRQIEILLVDDEADLRRLLAQTLRRAGYMVVEAGSGADALEALRSRAPGIQLLITDIVMPGIDGCDLAQRVEAKYPHIRSLFISGYTESILKPGAVCLQKPFSLSTFLESVQTILAVAPGAEAYNDFRRTKSA